VASRWSDLVFVFTRLDEGVHLVGLTYQPTQDPQEALNDEAPAHFRLARAIQGQTTKYRAAYQKSFHPGK
jgi:hypothetical protein